MVEKTLLAKPKRLREMYCARENHIEDFIGPFGGLDDRSQQLDVRCQKFNYLRSNYCRSESKMSVSLTESSDHVQVPYSDIKSKRVTRGVLGDSRYVSGHQQVFASRLVRKGDILPLLHVPAHWSRHFSLRYIVKEAEITVNVLTVYAAPNVVASYEWILGVLETCPFSD
ncbi:hypothetical protein TNCV_2826401 [Trichonephila clavipes]|nr:hypothetical protein TNCV_2826401 [Trichonephila clavipes]